MKTMISASGQEYTVCNCHYEKVKDLRLYTNPYGYANFFTRTYKPYKQSTHFLHRFIIGAQKGEMVDHIDQNKYNNQCTNLRFTTYHQNALNRSLKRSNKSGYIGVSWHKQKQKWTARVHHNGKYESLGLHATAEEAAKARDIRIYQIEGDFATLNFARE